MLLRNQTQKAFSKMPHRPEARRFAPQVRSVFHFCYAFLHLSCITKYLSPFFCTFLLCKLLSFGEKKAGFSQKAFFQNRAPTRQCGASLARLCCVNFWLRIWVFIGFNTFFKSFLHQMTLQTFCVWVEKSVVVKQTYFLQEMSLDISNPCDNFSSSILDLIQF